MDVAPHVERDLDLALDALRELISAGERYRAVLVSEFSVTTAETAAVGILYHRGQLSQTDLADHMKMSTSSVTAIVDRLENGGYAQRLTDPGDRRRNVITLTDKARAAVVEARDGLRSVFDAMAPADLGLATQVLSTISDGINLRLGVALQGADV